MERGSCAGFVMALWSHGTSMHDFRVMPWPKRLESHPDEWPKDVGRFWLQSHRNNTDENWDAAAVMTRSALQAALREKKAVGKNLRDEIDDLAEKGLLPPVMKDWAHKLRLLGNDSAHPEPGQDPIDPADARDATEFLDFLLECLYTLPHRIDTYRKRRKEK